MKTSEIDFIGRRKEIRQILEFLEEGAPSGGNVILVSGEGGIGKTRLLNEVRTLIGEKYKQLNAHKVVDFDNRRFNNPESISFFMIEALPNNEGFVEYFNAVDEFREIERQQVWRRIIEEKKKDLTNLFIKIYNDSVEGKQIWFFDTVERLMELGEEKENILREWIARIPRLNNTFFIFAGRNAGVEFLRDRFGRRRITSLILPLKPFTEEESIEYIDKKQKRLHISINEEAVRNLIKLSRGKPIFLDLAVEWFVQEVDMDFLEEIGPSYDIHGKARHNFEEKLISKTSELRYPLDWIVFALAHIHPLDDKGFDILFTEEKAEAYDFDELKKVVFIKTLPNGAIKLHDEMQRLVEEHLFEKIDEDLTRRRYYSEKILSHLRQEHNRQERTYIAAPHAQKIDAISQKKNKLHYLITKEEERVILNELTNQLIIHSFYADTEAGKQEFSGLMNELLSGRFTTPEVNALLKDLNEVSKILSFENDYDFIIGRADLQLYVEKYDEVDAELEKISAKASTEQEVEVLLLRSNVAVRRGKVSESIAFLKQAESLNEKIKNEVNKITLDIELGWNYRLIGNLELAKEKYQSAIYRILEKTDLDWKAHEELAIRYGWALNNLAFVLSDSNDTRRKAVDQANTAIEHWAEIKNTKGLGAGYSVSGITYYRIDKSDEALMQFGKALDIFEGLELKDWICQIYSWRGALFQDRAAMDDLRLAEEELAKALKIAERANKQIIPMTLNRLGRVYMTKQDWARALEMMQESLARAKELPDYVYWLGSIGRLGFILAEDSTLDYDFDQLKRELEIFNKAIKEQDISPELNSLGITHIAFARLEMLDLLDNPDDDKIHKVIDLLKEGIPLVTEYGSYARTDIRSRLAQLEKDFYHLPLDIIHKIGEELLGFVRKKAAANSSYLTVVNIMNKWKNWKHEE